MMQTKLGASIKLSKKEIFEGGCGILGMNRHTDI